MPDSHARTHPPTPAAGSGGRALPEPGVWTWPDVDDLSARLGVPFVTAADRDDAAGAVAAAVAWVADHSTVYHRWAAAEPIPPVDESTTVPPRLWRGVLDLSVLFYERRGSNVDPFDGLPVGAQTHYKSLLGVGRYAYPQVV